MLERVDDLIQVICEVAPTLKTGVFLYATVNRTRLSKLVLIKNRQDRGPTGSSQPNLHVWEKYIKSAELVAVMSRFTLLNQEMKGLSPKRRNPLALLGSLRAARKGRMSCKEVAAALALCETENVSTSYMGFALRQPAHR